MPGKLDRVLEKSIRNQSMSDDDLACLLLHDDEESLQKIFAASRAARYRKFGNKVFLYGFVYYSTFCRNDCSFCYYRNSNKLPHRYRKTYREIIGTAMSLKDSGVHLVDLTMGEDGYFLKNGGNLIDFVKAIKAACDIPVMISPGVLPPDMIKQLAEARADWYALYQETHNKKTFSELRLNQDYDVRMKAKSEASSCGMLIEEGILSGIGESVEDIIRSLHIIKEINASQARCMTFIPQPGTPMESEKKQDFLAELKLIAVLRLYLPDILIPASLDVDGIRGLKERLMAGANVVTSIIPPKKGYAGVANASRDIDEGFRTVSGIQDVLKECGLSQASLAEYREWMEKRKLWLKTNRTY
jgi:methylornithine synthase